MGCCAAREVEREDDGYPLTPRPRQAHAFHLRPLEKGERTEIRGNGRWSGPPWMLLVRDDVGASWGLICPLGTVQGGSEEDLGVFRSPFRASLSGSVGPRIDVKSARNRC